MSVNVSFSINTSSTTYSSKTNDTLYSVFIIDGGTYNSPISFSWVVGSTHSVSAINNSMNATGSLWNWVSWSNNGTQAQSFSAPASPTNYAAGFTLNAAIYTDIDPLTFIVSNYSGTVTDNNSAIVPIYTRFPDTTSNPFPMITLSPGSYTTQWAAIGAERLRYYQDVTMTIWALSPTQRYVIERSLRTQTTSINKTQLKQNYVFMWHPYNAYPDEVTMFGTAIFRTAIPLRIVYDLIRPN